MSGMYLQPVRAGSQHHLCYRQDNAPPKPGTAMLIGPDSNARRGGQRGIPDARCDGAPGAMAAVFLICA
jgi:hypothetical protein